MKQLFDEVSLKCSKATTLAYSTSFSLGIKFLDKKFHNPIYSIYGFVRFADEIVDTFHDFDKSFLLQKFRNDTYEAIEHKISLNPILNSFQKVVNDYSIERELIDTFLNSMEMDLQKQFYNQQLYQQYILGSAEVVGLMCLRVFCEGDNKLYESLKFPAMKLGAAFQKVNFLRDIKADNMDLGRTYFPEVDLMKFSLKDKMKIEDEIEDDFTKALQGIKRLPMSSRKGVYLAYFYYKKLFLMIKKTPAEKILNSRIRIPNLNKIGLMFVSLGRCQFNLL
jgi:phytoene/squalene synthetase